MKNIEIGRKSKMSFLDGDKGFCFGLLFISLACFFLIFGFIEMEKSSCDRVCEENDDVAQYEVFGGGCFCKNKEGLYNPRDSR